MDTKFIIIEDLDEIRITISLDEIKYIKQLPDRSGIVYLIDETNLEISSDTYKMIHKILDNNHLIAD